MAELEQASERALMRDMGFSNEDIERRKRFVGFNADDLGKIAAVKDVVRQHAEEYTKTFFNHLATLDEARPLLQNRAAVDRARQLKTEHLMAMVGGEYAADYVMQRIKLALLYSRAGLDQRVFLGAFHMLMRQVGLTIFKHFERAPMEGFESFMALKKIAFFDIGIITDALVFEREKIIRQQQESIRELSTPVLQVRDRMLLLPIIGVIDTHRARLVTESLLHAIRANRARVVVMDVTGVATIDSRVANHLLQTVTAARLMGATVIVSGLSAEVAQSLVALGIELSKFNAVGDLQGGVEEAERLLGYRMATTVEMPNGARPS
jgi:rsbT co-antagonist protein RsbR